MLKVLESFSNLVDVEKIKKKAGSPSGEPLYITSLPGSSRTLLINELFKNNNQIVVLFPDVKSVSEFNVELDTLELTNHSIAIDDYSHESLQEKLTDISKREKFILSAVYDILKYNLPAKNKIEQSTTLINSETGINYNELIEYLNFLNYTKDKFVETPGYYSLRGSIVDFWSYSEKNPVRLEFDGDFLESIRLFDPESQRSTKIIEQITLAASLNNDGINSSENSSSIFDYLNKPLVLASLYELNKLSDEKIIFTGDEPTTDVQLDEDKIAESTSEDIDIPDIIPEEEKDEEFEPKAVSGAYELHPNANWIIEDELGTNERLDLGFIEAPIIYSNYEVLNTILNQYAENNYKIIITAENEVQSYRLKDLLSEFKKELAELFESGKIKIEALTIKKGFINRNDKLLVLTDYQIFNKPFRTKIAATKVKKSKAKTFASIKKGDYVVHENYGIAKYLGLENINFGETTQESMKLQYAEGGIVYVNLNYLHLVKKYSSNDSLTPTLSTLGSNEWVNTKHKT
ncbi:MAG: CarD family transcriptional regulator, partial [Syntrophothermus sp.]